MNRFSRLSRYVAALTVLLAASIPAMALTATHFKSTSRLAKDAKWVKIRCTEPGIQAIPRDTLVKWGFRYPSRVQVYGFSTTQMERQQFMESLPDDLPEIPVLFDDKAAQPKLIFFNEGVTNHTIDKSKQTVTSRHNHYSNETYYILGEVSSQSAVVKPTEQAYKQNSSMDYEYHRSLGYTKVREFNPTQAGVFYFSGKTPASSPSPFPVRLTDPWPQIPAALGTAAKGNLFYRVGFGPRTTVGQLSVTATTGTTDITLDTPEFKATNSNQLGTRTYLRSAEASSRFTVGSGVTDASFDVTLSGATSNIDWIAYDYYGWTYLRKNILPDGQAQMSMYFDFANTDSSNFKLGATSPAPVVWDVTYPDSPIAIKTRTSGSSSLSGSVIVGSLPSRNAPSGYTNTTRVVAFRPEAELPQPTLAGTVTPQDLHSAEACDMIIITNNGLRTAAERLAQVHRDIQGMDVVVASHDQILNEFSSGTPHVMGYRLFAKMLYERGKKADGTSRLRYIILMGPSVWDNIHAVMSPGDYLLSYQTEDDKYASYSTESFVSNDIFGNLADNFSVSSILTAIPQVAVGMIDAYNLTEANNAIDKIANYLDNPPVDDDYYNRAVILADTGDNIFLKDGENNTSTLRAYNPAITASKAYLDLYPYDTNGEASYLRESLTSALKSGRYLWSYTGHANPIELKSDQMLWNISLVKSTPVTVLPFAMMATCRSYTFDQLENSIVRNMIIAPDGGAIAVVASAREVMSHHNQKLNLEFSKAFYGAKPGMSIGDVYLNAKRNLANTYGTAGATLVNTLCYNLAGDPAIPVIAPSRTAVATAIAGTDVRPSWHDQQCADVKVSPLAPFTLSGKIMTDAMLTDTDTSFDGTVYISVYDGGQPVKTASKLGNQVGVVQMDETLLARTATKVSAGEFSTTITLPEGIVNDTINRVTFFAVNTDRTLFATGLCNSLQLQKLDPDKVVADTSAPVISEFYIDSPDFTDGSTVAPTFTVHATFTDEGSGINSASGLIGGDPVLILDGTRSYSDIRAAMRPGNDGEMTIVYPVTDMADGLHTLSLTVSDRASNTASRSISFTVRDGSIDASLAVAEEPARDKATFSLTGDNTASVPETTIVIRDADGRTVHSASSVAMPYVWDLKDNSGNLVEDGTYSASLLLKDGNLHGHAPAISFIVVK